MAEISLANQPFDLAFHPSEPLVFVGLLTGHITAYAYTHDRSEEDFVSNERFSVRPSKRSCRGLTTSETGDAVYGVTKDKSLHAIDVKTGAVVGNVLAAHEAAINRVILTSPNVLATGDDDGIVKLWDTRALSSSSSSASSSSSSPPTRPTRTYSQHTDYISDFLYLPDKRHLVSTSADGTLSVIDVRAGSKPLELSGKKKKNKKKKGKGGGQAKERAEEKEDVMEVESADVGDAKGEPFAQSEDQEDELLSIVGIRGYTKTAVGTQSGILSIFNNEKSGWGDSVDRIPGHPSSIDSLCSLPAHLLPSSNSAQAIVATGSSDGMVRLVQLFPTKVLGVVADHGEFPVERIKMDRPGSGEERWLGSIGHSEKVVFSDLKDVLEDSDDEDESDSGDDDDSDEDMGSEANEKSSATRRAHDGSDSDSDSDADSDEDAQGDLAMDNVAASDSDIEVNLDSDIDDEPDFPLTAPVKIKDFGFSSIVAAKQSSPSSSSIKPTPTEASTATSSKPDPLAGFTFSGNLLAASAAAVIRHKQARNEAILGLVEALAEDDDYLEEDEAQVEQEEAEESDGTPPPALSSIEKKRENAKAKKRRARADSSSMSAPLPAAPAVEPTREEDDGEGRKKKKRKKDKGKTGASGVDASFFDGL